jgi:hypothetical protein
MGPYSEGRKWVSVMIKMQLFLGLVNHCAMKTCRNGGIVPCILTLALDRSEWSVSQRGCFTLGCTVDRRLSRSQR